MTISSEILVLFLLVLANGFLALSEIAVVSARTARLRERADDGDGGARAALELRAEPGRFLSTVQIGITLVGVCAGAFGGVTLGADLAPALARLPGVAGRHAEELAVGLVVLLVSYVSVVVGELVPKQLALRHPETLAARTAKILRLLSRLAAPAVWVLDRSTRLVLRLLRTLPSAEPSVTEEELRHVLELGRRSGLLEPTEQKIAERALRLGERSVGDLVIPRVDLVTLDVNDPPEVVVRKVEGSEQVLFPVSDGGPDEIVGVVSLRQLFARHGSGRVDRSDLQAAVYLPETLGALDALERFRRDRLEEALVFDEHGGLEGMVTLRRFTEALVGDLPSPAEPEPLVVRRGDGSLLVDGSLATAELAAILELDPALGETLEQSRTVGGFVLAGLGRVPREGDELDWGDWRFEVVDMDRRRVDKVLVVRPGAAEAEPPTE